MSDKEPIDWDALDADTQHELVSLAEKLGEEEPETQSNRTASRREFLGAVTAAGLGGSLLSQGADRAFEDFVNPASAGTQSVAQFGEAGEPFDFIAEDIYGPGGKGSGDPVNFEQIGSSSNRVTDIYGASADFSSVSTDEQQNAGDIHVVRNDGSLVERLDPSGSTTPIQDARDIASTAGGGVIKLPPGEINDTGPLSWQSKVSMIGAGDPATIINITGSGNDGLRFDDTSAIFGCHFDDFRISGPGATATTGIGIHYVTRVYDISYGNVSVADWNNIGYKVDSGANPSNLRHRRMRLTNIDAGNNTAVVNFEDGGPNVSFEHLNIAPTDASSGTWSQGVKIVNQTGFTCESINVGGTAGLGGQIGGAAVIDYMNYEPTEYGSAVIYAWRLNQGQKAVVGLVEISTGTVDYVLQFASGPGAKTVGAVDSTGTSTVNTTLYSVESDTSGRIKIGETSNDIDNNSGTSPLTEPVSCLGDLTLFSG